MDIEAETDEQRRRAYAKWYKAIKNRYLVSSYKLIPRHLSEEVISWLVQLAAIAGREKGKASRNSSPLRVNLFKQIWTVSGQLGLPKGEVYDIVLRGLGKRVTSLKRLSDDDLSALLHFLNRFK